MWITTAAQLAEKLPMTAEELAAVQAVADRYPMCITPYYLGLIDPNDPDDPIRKMAVPAPIEEEEGGSFDTSGEQSNTRVPGLQHKYLQTAMVLTTNRCAMYCRHCFRKRLVGLTDEEIAANFERVTGYIREHEEITNVLLSGGDSFLNSNETIARYLDALTPIGHLNYIRFGTRTPVTWPERIDEALCETLARYTARKTIFVVTQFNHPREITPESAAAVAALRRAGCIVRNQTVLLRGVNDDPAVLGELLASLTAIGCLPYYIFQCRPVTGVKNMFQVPMERGIEIVENAKRLISGMDKAVKYCLSPGGQAGDPHENRRGRAAFPVPRSEGSRPLRAGVPSQDAPGRLLAAGRADARLKICQKRETPGRCPGISYGSAVFSISCSILAISSLGRMRSASAILKKVSSVGRRSPRSMALRCVRPIPAKPLTTSCESPFSSRSCCITFPTTTASSILTPPVQIECKDFFRLL